MIVVERTFAVTAAPGVVLAYLQDFANAQHWDPSAERTSRIDAGPPAPGAHWRHARKLFGVSTELTYTLLAAEPGRLVFHGRSEGATCTDTVTLRALPDGTEVTYRVELEVHGLAKLAAPLMKAELEKLATESVAAVTTTLSGTQPEVTHEHRLGAATPNRLPTPAEETG
jgi:carbon monoxide dehydrogenase subunit G